MSSKLSFTRALSDQVAQTLLAQIESGQFAQATGDPYFDFLTQYLTASTHVIRAKAGRWLEFTCHVRDQHSATIEAIRRRDATDAQNAAAVHLFNGARQLAAAEFRSSSDRASFQAAHFPSPPTNNPKQPQ
jgi:DNA-binding FadR family transcriptional regulator